MNQPETKHIKNIQALNPEAIERKLRGQRAYVDGLFLSFQSQTVCRDTVPANMFELGRLAAIAREMADEIDTLLDLARKYQEGMKC
jgi:hypothetical protein